MRNFWEQVDDVLILIRWRNFAEAVVAYQKHIALIDIFSIGGCVNKIDRRTEWNFCEIHLLKPRRARKVDNGITSDTYFVLF